MKNRILKLSKIALVIAAAMLVASLFVPLWQIDLDAPQYPEGLKLLIWADKIDGDVDIINGLNHYIGMKTLHTEDFIEFTILPYLIGGFAVLFLATALIGRKGLLYFCLVAFVIFGVAAMVDFWLWEYDYGHNLDPNAAIKVPGMAYQPPLIGFKQLLNFGAFSIPAAGGWLFIGAGLLILLSVLNENRFFERFRKSRKSSGLAALLLFGLLASSCESDKPQSIKLNIDNCHFCRMTISDGRFGTELITQKGRVYMFDDFSCMTGFMAEHSDVKIRKYYINDYLKNNELIDATSAWFVHDQDLKSPMGGNIAAFSSREEAQSHATKANAVVEDWNAVKEVQTGHQHGDHEHHH